METVNHPAHYNQHPSGIEAIDLCELLSFNLGNAVKYLMRADHKGQRVEDLKKARWYLVREQERAPVQSISPTAMHLAGRMIGYEPLPGRPLGWMLDALIQGHVRLDDLEMVVQRIDDALACA